ncbi:MAG: ABC transporter permease [Pirellula sp.]|nr:ABC transporter permease [Pirellula sp.]
MNWVAWKMLTGNRGKYLAIIMGVTFGAFLIAQQASVFCGLMMLTTSQIKDIEGAEIWAMDKNMQYVDDIKPMSDNELWRVRGVEGVDWAVRLYKGITRARLEEGTFQQIIMIGLDDATMVGAPREIIVGSIDDLRRPDAVIMDEAGFRQLWPDEPFSAGKVFEMNDRRAVVVGVCKSRKTFMTFPIIYTRYSQAVSFVPMERKVLSFILANPKPDVSAEEVCRRIEAQTDLQAQTRAQFEWTTIWYYFRKTGIPFNFFTTVLLGFIVGAAICGQTFYMFTLENLKQFGALKAMGARNLQLVRMIMLQALTVGFIGFGLGIGSVAMLFGEFIMRRTDKLAFFMPWQVVAITGGSILVMVIFSALFSVWKVLRLEPAVVFKG